MEHVRKTSFLKRNSYLSNIISGKLIADVTYDDVKIMKSFIKIFFQGIFYDSLEVVETFLKLNCFFLWNFHLLQFESFGPSRVT